MNCICSLKIVLLLIALIFQSCVALGAATAATSLPLAERASMIVPDNYETIQEAVNAATAGDTIEVRNGTYYENVLINKTISLLGEDPKTTIVDGSKSNSTYGPTVWIQGIGAKDVKICNLTLTGSSNAPGIYVNYYANAWVEKTIVSNNSGGIFAGFSNNNTFINNTITNNRFEGILLFGSSENTLRNNVIGGNPYNFGVLQSGFNNDIDTSNLVDGKPICYLKDQNDLTIDSDVGYLALVNCANITVENLTLQNNYNGFLLVATENSTIRNNHFGSNMRGLDVINSNGNTIETNSIANSTWQAVSLDHAPRNTFRRNNLTNNEYGVKVEGDSLSDFSQEMDTSNTVDGKAIQYLLNYTDLALSPSSLDNTGYLALINCSNMEVRDFSLKHNNLLVAFTENCSIAENVLTFGEMDIADSSFINVTGNAIINGQTGVLIHHCNNSAIAGNNVTKNSENGIAFETSSNNTMSCNIIRENKIGISVRDSSNNNTVSGNDVTENDDYSINIWNSSFNRFFHNNLIGSVPWQVTGSYCIDNEWDNGYPSGGNYWSDYSGSDTKSGSNQDQEGPDGIGDTRHTTAFFGIADHYPLIQPIRSFSAGVWGGKTRDIDVISNSTLSGFTFDHSARTISFDVAGEEGTKGFCRITVPNTIVQNLWNGSYSVTIDGQPQPSKDWADTRDTYIYVNYTHSEHQIVVVPEFPNEAILAIFVVTVVFFAIRTRKLNKCKVSMTKTILV